LHCFFWHFHCSRFFYGSANTNKNLKAVAAAATAAATHREGGMFMLTVKVMLAAKSHNFKAAFRRPFL
jgi:hypothetical protein